MFLSERTSARSSRHHQYKEELPHSKPPHHGPSLPANCQLGTGNCSNPVRPLCKFRPPCAGRVRRNSCPPRKPRHSCARRRSPRPILDADSSPQVCQPKFHRCTILMVLTRPLRARTVAPLEASISLRAATVADQNQKPRNQIARHEPALLKGERKCHESRDPVDRIPYPFPGTCLSTHPITRFYRRSRPRTIRSPRRLPRRVL